MLDGWHARSSQQNRKSSPYASLPQSYHAAYLSMEWDVITGEDVEDVANPPGMWGYGA
jgi:hypothetical protein